uniref:Aminoacyl-tRNA synthetase class Ia domain-containing protein n=1 Tax=Leersia perrieri TaxID=77586 RepID=A0A0D9WV26_9ORYZ
MDEVCVQPLLRPRHLPRAAPPHGDVRHWRQRVHLLRRPPFATGLPHYGHLTGMIKDTVTRHHSMRGCQVAWRFGWDFHGVYVEHEIERSPGIKSSCTQVLVMGIGEYTEVCHGVFGKYTAKWEVVVRRMGRWVDFDCGYKTMDMESVWWFFAQLWEKKLN